MARLNELASNKGQSPMRSLGDVALSPSGRDASDPPRRASEQSTLMDTGGASADKKVPSSSSQQKSNTAEVNNVVTNLVNTNNNNVPPANTELNNLVSLENPSVKERDGIEKNKPGLSVEQNGERVNKSNMGGIPEGQKTVPGSKKGPQIYKRKGHTLVVNASQRHGTFRKNKPLKKKGGKKGKDSTKPNPDLEWCMVGRNNSLVKCPPPQEENDQPPVQPAPLNPPAVVAETTSNPETATRESDNLEGEPLIDTHFHWQRLSSQANKPKVCKINDLSEKKLTGGVTIYCDPVGHHQFPSISDMREMKRLNPQIKLGMGIHPIYSNNYFPDKYGEALERLEEAQNQDLLSAVGEFGFDLGKGGTIMDQCLLNNELLRVADPDLPLVIHVRGRKGDKTSKEAFEHCHKFLVRNIEKTRKFQLHCFSGDVETLEAFRSTFPNCYFSYSGMVSSFNEDQKKALNATPSNRLLVETDAPYFAGERGKINNPFTIGRVIREVAKIRNCAVEAIARVNLVNAEEIFGSFSPSGDSLLVSSAEETKLLAVEEEPTQDSEEGMEPEDDSL